MIEVGSLVKDLINDMEGVAVARTEWLYGCARVGIEATSLSKDGKPQEIHWVDEQRVEEIKKNHVKPKKPPKCDIKLGSKVKDTITGFEGIASAKTVWIGGNLNIAIEPGKLNEGKPIDPHCFDCERVELIEEKAPPVSKANSAVSGGPQNDPKQRVVR